MENAQTLLPGASDTEKGAYLGAIASLATADRQATAEEIEYLRALCEAAQLSEEQSAAVIKAATEITHEEALRCLDVIKGSDLKYSLVTDVIAFAKSDNDYSEHEQHKVEQMAQYLGVDQKQFSVLDQLAEKATASQVTPEEMANPGFLSSLGLQDKLQSAGINGAGLLKGLLGIAAPLILAKMFSGRRGSGGMFGGSGGMFGGGGGMFGGSGGLMGGGLGSLIGMLSGGRGMGSLGGIFGSILGGRKRW